VNAHREEKKTNKAEKRDEGLKIRNLTTCVADQRKYHSKQRENVIGGAKEVVHFRNSSVLIFRKEMVNKTRELKTKGQKKVRRHMKGGKAVEKRLSGQREKFMKKIEQEEPGKKMAYQQKLRNEASLGNETKKKSTRKVKLR